VCGRTNRVRQKSRSEFWTPRPSRGGPERSGGRAAVPGREQSHPLRHLIFEAFLRLESLRLFPTASLLPNSGDSGGRTTINLARFVAAFTEEIAARELRIAAPAAGRSFPDVARHPHSKTTCEYGLLLKTILRIKRYWLASEPPGSHAYGVCVIDHCRS
jgi:hypothetical protein